jgi:predicted nucleic acid-binding protein
MAVTSTITMTELLVQPYRDLNEHRVEEFYGLLSTYPNLDWISPNLEIADLAARIRALHRLRTPDALQAASAAHLGATGFITNDPVFERILSFETLVLDSLL